MSEPSIRRAGLTLVAFAVIGKVIGFLREAAIAGTYGTSQIVDIYLAAVAVPALINGILYQALPNAFIPLFARARESSSQTRRVAWGVLVIMVFISAGLWLFATTIAALTNSGFSASLRAETVFLVRIMSGSVFLGTIEALARSRLLAQKRFVQTGISSLLLSFAVIAAVVFFPGGGARTLAWGFFAGAACVALWNVIPFGKPAASGLATPEGGIQSGSSNPVGGWVAAVILLNTVNLLYGLIDRHLGSYLVEGSIAALQYSSIVATQPLAICATAIGMAIFPYLSDRVTANDHAGSASLFDRAMRWALLGAIPSAIVVSLLGNAAVTVLFERGQFDAGSRTITGSLLAIYGVWIVPAVMGTVVGKVFYAGLRWRPILLAISLSLLVKTGLSFWWVRTEGVIGLVWATTVAVLVSVVILFGKMPRWGTQGLWPGWIRLALTTGALFAVPCLMGRLLPAAIPSLPWKIAAFASVVTGTGGGSVLLLVFGPRLGIKEIVTMRTTLGAILLHRK